MALVTVGIKLQYRCAYGGYFGADLQYIMYTGYHIRSDISQKN